MEEFQQHEWAKDEFFEKMFNPYKKTFNVGDCLIYVDRENKNFPPYKIYRVEKLLSNDLLSFDNHNFTSYSKSFIRFMKTDINIKSFSSSIIVIGNPQGDN